MKMHRALYHNLILTYMVYGILAFLTVVLITSPMLKNYLVQEHIETIRSEATYIANTYAKGMYDGSVSKEEAYLQLKAIDKYIDCEIWILDSSGRLIIDSRDEGALGENIVIEGFDPTSNSQNYEIGDYYGNFKEEVISTHSPINTGFKIRGYVVIHKPMSSIISQKDELINISYVTMLVLIMLSLIILAVFTVIVYKPLKKIITAAEEYAKGNYSHTIKVKGSDEMSYLAGTLEYMASEIDRAEDNQKKFIANVSHDFKSPLTSIRGYIEAMKDGTIPLELHDKYLGIVLKETERLTGLTNSLLQLNNLNVKGLILEITDFDINQVIKGVCEAFEGRCVEKHIVLDLVLVGNEMLVKADVSKIQQVLYNLLDNALKFSHDNSTIKIETNVKGDKLFVSVKDNGIGIPKDSVNMVFDRFYKTDLSRGKDKKGTGLGLSIVKEIIKSHEENINVISTEGVGTEFIFSLKRA